MSVIEEPSKNGIVHQIIERKIGRDFTVTKKPITEHDGNKFSQYCRSSEIYINIIQDTQSQVESHLITTNHIGCSGHDNTVIMSVPLMPLMIIKVSLHLL